MGSLKFIIVLVTLVVAIQADKEGENNGEIFKKCAEANGLKHDPERMKRRQEAERKGERPPPPGEQSEEMSCTMKCVWEKTGLLVGNKPVLDEVKNDRMAQYHIGKDKLDAFLKCIKDIEIKTCSDMNKIHKCRK